MSLDSTQNHPVPHGHLSYVNANVKKKKATSKDVPLVFLKFSFLLIFHWAFTESAAVRSMENNSQVLAYNGSKHKAINNFKWI